MQLRSLCRKVAFSLTVVLAVAATASPAVAAPARSDLVGPAAGYRCTSPPSTIQSITPTETIGTVSIRANRDGTLTAVFSIARGTPNDTYGVYLIFFNSTTCVGSPSGSADTLTTNSRGHGRVTIVKSVPSGAVNVLGGADNGTDYFVGSWSTLP